MIKRVKIFSRKEIEAHVMTGISPVEGTWALISIYAENMFIHFSVATALEKLNCKSFLSLQFEDITQKECLKLQKDRPEEKRKLFNNKIARIIINFLDQINDENIDTLVLHCAAGISRSGAVGLFANQYYKLDHKEFMRDNSRIIPNMYILSVLNEESGLYSDYVKFWENENNDQFRKQVFGTFDK